MLSTSMHESCATLNPGINCFSSSGAYLFNFAFNFQSSVLSGATIDDDPEAECRRCCAFNFPVSASVCYWVGGCGLGGGGEESKERKREREEGSLLSLLPKPPICALGKCPLSQVSVRMELLIGFPLLPEGLITVCE